MSTLLFQKDRLQGYPDAPGVYLMKDSSGTILYIGKANSIRVRLKQYFSPYSSDERVQIPHLLAKVTEIETILTGSEKEALLLEARLIRRFKPQYNVLLKDDRSQLLIYIDMKHPFPGIQWVREKEISRRAQKVFGPFPSSYIARRLFDLAIRLFQVRQCSDNEFSKRNSPCLLYQIKRCSAPCVHLISEESYAEKIAFASNLLSGKTKDIQKDLKKQIEMLSSNLDFEKAAVLAQELMLLQSYSGEKKVAMRPGEIDVIGYAVCKDLLCVCFLHYKDTVLQFADNRLFSFSSEIMVQELFEQVLAQYYLMDESVTNLPKMIVLPQEFFPLAPFSEAIYDIDPHVQISSPKNASLLSFQNLATENAQAALFQNATVYENMAILLKKKLHLKNLPLRIDCFDGSHLSGKEIVAACVSFLNEKKDTKNYRTFHIRLVSVGDDLSMLKEAISRRYKKEKLPDLLLIDGGKTHLQACCKILKEIDEKDAVDVAAIAKESSRHDKGMTKETIYVKGYGEAIHLQDSSPELLFLQKIRDEAHRFVISFQRKTHKKNMFFSVLENIPGIGPVKKKALFSAFSGLHELAESDAETIAQKSGISLKDAQNILKAFL